MTKSRIYLPVALIALIVWTPLIAGGTTYIGFTISRAIILAMMVIALLRVSGSEPLSVPRHWSIAGLVVLAMLLLIGGIRAVNGYAGMNWMINYAGMGVVFVAAARMRDDERRWVLYALLVSAGFEAIWGIIEYLGALEPRSNGTFFNPNYFGGYLAAVAVWLWGQIAFHKRKSVGATYMSPVRFPIWAKLLILAILLAGVFVSQSRGAVIAIFVGFVAVGMARWGLKVIPALAVLAILALLVPNPFSERLKSLSDTDIYAWSRFDMWKSAGAMIADHPEGVGAGMFQYYSYSYAFPVERAFGRYAQVAEAAHSALLDIAAELGPASLVIVLAIGCFLVFWGLKNARKTRDAEIAGAMGALAVILAHSTFDSMQKSNPEGYIAAIFAGILIQNALSGVKGISIPLSRKAAIFALIVPIAALYPVVTTFLGWEFKTQARKANAAGDSRMAGVWLERAVAANPGYDDVWARLGDYEMLHWLNNKHEENFHKAEHAYRMAIEVNPMGAKVRSQLAELLLSRDDWENYKDAAMELLKKNIALQPYNPFHHTRLAALYRKIGRNGEAEAEIRKALDIEPRYAAAYVMLGDLLVSEGRGNEAAIYYRLALDILPEAPQTNRTTYIQMMVQVKEASVRKKLAEISPAGEGFTPTP